MKKVGKILAFGCVATSLVLAGIVIGQFKKGRSIGEGLIEKYNSAKDKLAECRSKKDAEEDK